MPHSALLLVLLSSSLLFVEAAILDFDLLMDHPAGGYDYDMVAALNQSRDAKRNYGGYGYGHYRPYYRPKPTEAPKVEAPLECGSGSFDGGPALTCMLRTECLAQGGSLGEPCGKGFSRGFCCQFRNVLKCGETTSEVSSIFRNPDYPDSTSNPIACIVGIIPRPEACGIRLEFMEALMAPSRDGFCHQDMFTVVGGGQIENDGFNTNFCGLVKGYGTVIPVNQTSDLVQLVVLAQSRDIVWNINVTQVHCGSLYLPFNDLCGVQNSQFGRKVDSEPAEPAAEPVKTVETPAKVPLKAAISPKSLNESVGAEGKILGGAALGGNRFPWMSAILYDGSHICSGSLISRQWVMTAAHCVTFYAADGLFPVRRMRAWLGAYDLSKNFKQEPLRLVRKIERVYIHNEFQGNNYDVALMKLNETVIYNVAIRPICFQEDIEQNYVNWQGIITGWGTNGGPTKSNTLLQGTVPIVSNTACAKAWSALDVEIRYSMICAGDGSVAQCTGDSGGPLLTQDEDGLFSIAGISSFSAPPACGNPDYPDVYMRVTYFASWVALVLALPPPPEESPIPFGPYGP